MASQKGLARRASIVPVDQKPPYLSVSQLTGVITWAESCTDATSPRFRDLVRDKARAVAEFFDLIREPINMITAIHVKEWQAKMEKQGLSPSTVYGKISRLSSFFDWLLAHAEMRDGLKLSHNPVNIARPRAPKAYQSESVKALSLDEVNALIGVVRGHAGRSLVGKRDYAMIVLYLLTGMRRAEIARLRWRDVRLEPILTLAVRLKGGERVNVEVDDPAARDLILDYLRESERLSSMKPDSPLWAAHDPGAGGSALTSHGFVKNLKKYAKEAGLEHIHLHQTRHTVAREVAERDGLDAAREKLGHHSLNNTRIYVQRVGTRRDRHSRLLADVFGIHTPDSEE